MRGRDGLYIPGPAEGQSVRLTALGSHSPRAVGQSGMEGRQPCPHVSRGLYWPRLLLFATHAGGGAFLELCANLRCSWWVLPQCRPSLRS